MIRLELKQTPTTVGDARAMLATAIGVEFGTLPPYLYALYTIRPGSNAAAYSRIKSVVLQEMIHMCLGCNMLNALGGNPASSINVQAYPGPLPGDIGPDGKPLTIHLYPFSPDAMDQAMKIEQPEHVPDFPVVAMLEAAAAAKALTIGQFYAALDVLLQTLPSSVWQPGRNQIVDDQFFQGQLFAVNGYADAHAAIGQIVSEGEGAKDDPLDFQDEIAHYYRFGEIFNRKVLTKAANPLGYAWGPAVLDVDWSGAFPAITDPALHDFNKDPPAAQQAQKACNSAFSNLVDDLRSAVAGSSGTLGEAVRAMYDLRMAAKHAVTVPLANPAQVAGPAFVYIKPEQRT